MKFTFAKAEFPTQGAIVVPVYDGKTWGPLAKSLDDATVGSLTRAAAAGRFEGKKDQVLSVLAPSGLSVSRVVLIGLGKPKEVDALVAQAFGGKAVAQVQTSGDDAVWVLVEPVAGVSLSDAEFAANAALGGRLRGYRFDKYRTKQKNEDKPSLRKVTIATGNPTGAKAAFAPLDKIADGVFLARDFVSEPANVIHPESYAESIKKLESLGLKVEVLGEKQMRKLGMGSLLGVGQGSDRESQLVIMQWNGAAKADEAPVAFVGKGVTFDTGGISLKPGAGMEDMKWDMAGSAAVVGAMAALAGRKAKANVVGVVGLVENMPSGGAQRPGDVVTSMSGQTIEVINTDAEGRLVLADAIWYTQQEFKPKAVIDLATLTGAIIVALGNEYAGLFSNDDKLSAKLTEAGKKAGEQLWRMPIGDAYDQLIKSDIADMKNTGGRDGGSISAAMFIKRFVRDVPWAHLDIAGMAWFKKDGPVTPKGASAFGVRLLDRLIADNFED